MTLSESLLPEFDQEMASTRKCLARVPENKFGWKPHQKSGSMIWLAHHLSQMPSWAVMTVKTDSLDMAPGGVPMKPPPAPASTADLLAQFDKDVAAARGAIASASDTHLLKPWSLLDNGKIMLTMSRLACLRTWVMNHTIHHRAQLGVYLRLNNIAVPAVYGPSADETGF